MKLEVFRISKLQYAQSRALAEHGIGAARFGGRWNSPDTALQADRRIIYASDTLAQSMLEIVVHAEGMVLKTVAHAYIRLSIKEKYIAELDTKQLPSDWNSNPAAIDTQVIGDQWYDEKVSPFLRVPSAILPLDVYNKGQSNYLINARHPEIKEAVQMSGYYTLFFDNRLQS